jgi:fatty acid desaturase
MDGGRIFRSFARFFMPRAKATYVAMVVGRAVAVLLVLLPLLGISSIWIIPIGGSFILRLLIAFMIWTEGYREYKAALQEENFRKWTQADFEARVSPPPYDM